MRAIFKKLSNIDLSCEERQADDCLYYPMPFDLKVLRQFDRETLEIEIYVWLSFALPFLMCRKTISWENIKKYFCSQKNTTEEFKNMFLRSLNAIKSVYQQANIEVTDYGLILFPSPPHSLNFNIQILR